MKWNVTAWLAPLRRSAAFGPVMAFLDRAFAPVAAFFAIKEVNAVVEWLKEPVYAVALMFALTTIIAQPFYVPSGSMEPTLAIGDGVLAAKFPYGYNRFSIPDPFGHGGATPQKTLWPRLPKVGDVVVFRLPGNTAVTFVKRVIGLPGDRIQMKHGRLWINGKQLPVEPAGLDEDEDSYGGTTMVPVYIETLPGGRKHRIFKQFWEPDPRDYGFDANNTEVYVVPPGHLFMMGDNRDDSCDSRFPVVKCGVGFVPAGNLVGRAFIVVGSVDFKNARGVWEWPFYLRWSRFLHGIH